MAVEIILLFSSTVTGKTSKKDDSQRRVRLKVNYPDLRQSGDRFNMVGYGGA